MVTLPPEIAGMIVDCLPHQPDLSRLARTCKTLNGIVIPKLYRRIVLRVPQRWERLDSLLNLVASGDNGFKYTSEIFVEPQQRPRDEDQYSEQAQDNPDNDEFDNDPSDAGPSEYSSDNEDLRSFLPHEQDSVSLNRLIQRLVKQVPRNQLSQFVWDHTCVVDRRTLALLFDMHGAALRTLKLYQQTFELPGPLPDGLHNLHLGSLDKIWEEDYPDPNRFWQTALVAGSCKTLRHLELGFETHAAQNFPDAPIGDNDRENRRQTTTFGRALKRECQKIKASISLNSLKLISYDIEVILDNYSWPHLDLRNIKKLVLEDCHGTKVALEMLSSISSDPENAHCLMNLTSFTFRQRNLEDDDRIDLQIFLCSLSGRLIHLSVLLDRHEDDDHMLNLKPILLIHGKTLRTLVWDERGYRQEATNKDRALLPRRDRMRHLSTISKLCPDLKELGVAIDWAAVRVSNESRQKLSDHIRKLKRLQTLNIRNMPSAPANMSWLPFDLHKAWAVSLIENLVQGGHKAQSPPALKTIALGALTWSDVWLGSNYHCSNYVHSNSHERESIREFLQLRVYRIHYQHDSQGGCSPTLVLVAKGSPRDIQRESSSLNILEPYWLG